MSRQFGFTEHMLDLGNTPPLWLLVRDPKGHGLLGSFCLGMSICSAALEYALVAVHQGAHSWTCSAQQYRPGSCMHPALHALAVACSNGCQGLMSRSTFSGAKVGLST